MFVVQKESGWNMVSEAMKYATAITYRRGLGWGWHIKLPLPKGGSLLRVEVAWVKTGLGGAWRSGVLGQS